MAKHLDTTDDDLAKLKEAVRLLRNCDPNGAKAVAATMSNPGKKKFIKQMRKFSA